MNITILSLIHLTPKSSIFYSIFLQNLCSVVHIYLIACTFQEKEFYAYQILLSTEFDKLCLSSQFNSLSIMILEKSLTLSDLLSFYKLRD